MPAEGEEMQLPSLAVQENVPEFSGAQALTARARVN